MGKTKVMGILNVTPDSFSDGGRYQTETDIHGQVALMLAQDVDIIDVGGESTRPFAEPVSEEEELQRVVPAIRMIRSLSSTVPVSVDTTKARVAAEALSAGADMVNDISALRFDPDMLDVVQNYPGPLIIMHMQGEPGSMQVNPCYENVVSEICDFFTERIKWLESKGVDPSRIIIDPGIGFGKTLKHNLQILSNIKLFSDLGCPVLIGHSRKSFFEKLLGIPLQERDCPTAIVSALCVKQNVDYLRVHDVKGTQVALKLAEAISF